jgi:hypothetical protein
MHLLMLSYLAVLQGSAGCHDVLYDCHGRPAAHWVEVHFSTLLLSLLHRSGRTLGQPVKGPDVALGLLRHRTHWFRILNITEIE